MAYLELPNGKYIKVPEGMSPDQAYDAAITKFPDLLSDQPKAKKGMGAALGKGVESFLGTGQTTVESLFGANEAAKRGLEREAALGQKYEDQIGLDKLKEAYEKKGITGAAGELGRQVPLALLEQAPNIAASLGSAKLGAMAGTAVMPGVGTAIGAGLGALTPAALQLFGSNVQRQAAEQEQAGAPVDINVGRALGATAVQAPLDVAATFIPLGGKVAGKLFGPEIEKLLARGGTKAAEKLAQESFLKTAGKGLAVGAAAEIPTEILQQVAERAQAGLSLTSPDALKEYGETAYQVGLLAPIGGAGRFIDKSAAKTQVEEKKQEDRRAAQEQARIVKEVEQQREEAIALNKAQQETGSLFGEAPLLETIQNKEVIPGAVNELENLPSTLTVREREAQAEQQQVTQESERSALLKQADLFDKQLLDIEKQRDAAAEKGDFKVFGELDTQARALEESVGKISSALKELPANLSPEMEMAKLRGEQKNLIKQLQGMTGPSYDSKKAAVVTTKLAELDKKIESIAPAASQMDLFDEAQMSAEERTAKKQQAEARSQEQADLLEALKPEGKREVLDKEAIDRYQKGLQDLEDAYAAGADERIVNRLIDELQRVGQEKDEAIAKSTGVTGPAQEEQMAKIQRVKRAMDEEVAKFADATTEEEVNAIRVNLGALQKRYALAQAERAKAQPQNVEVEASQEQRDAILQAVENVRLILSGEYINSRNVDVASSLKSTLEDRIRDAGGMFTTAAIKEINAVRAINKQQPLTNDEGLKLASAVKSRFDFIVKDPTYLANREIEIGRLKKQLADTPKADTKRRDRLENTIKELEKNRNKNLTVFKDALERAKVALFKGPTKLQKETPLLKQERDAVGMLRKELAKKEPDQKRIAQLQKEVAVGKAEDERIAAEKAKQEASAEVDVSNIGNLATEEEKAARSELPKEKRYPIDQQSLFGEKELAPVATVRATPENFQRFVGIQANKFKQAKEVAERAIAEAKERATKAKERADAKATETAQELIRQIAEQRNLVEDVIRKDILISDLRGQATRLWQERGRLVKQMESVVPKLKNVKKDLQNHNKQSIAGWDLNSKKTQRFLDTRKKLEIARDNLKLELSFFQKQIQELDDTANERNVQIDALYAKINALKKINLEREQALLDRLEKAYEKTPEAKSKQAIAAARAEIGKTEAAIDASLKKQVKEKRVAEQEALEFREALPSITRETVETLKKVKGKGGETLRREKITRREVPLTAEEKKQQAIEKARAGAAERKADKEAIKARLGTSQIVESKELTDVLNRQAGRGVERIAAQPGRTERKKPLKTGVKKVDVTKQGMKAVRDVEQEARDIGVSREDFEFVERGLMFGFKARDEKTQGAGVSQADVKKELGKVEIPKGLNIIVIDKISGSLAELIQARGYDPKTIRGAVMANGTVLIVAGNHIDIKDVKATIAHELIGHVGVEGLLGEAGMRSLAKRIQKDENSVFELAKKLGVFDDVLGAYSAARRYMSEEDAVAQAVRELIAHVEEASPNRNFLEKANAFIKAMVGAVRAALRKLGLDLDISTSDIYKLLRDARANFKDMAPGAHINKDGNIVFSGKPAVANAGFENALEYTKGIVAEQKSLKDRILGEASGLIIETKYFDSVAPVTKALESIKDSLKATQVMHYIRKHGQRMAITSEVATNGPMNIVAKKRGDGQTEYMIESKEGANMVQMAEALREADVGNIEATVRVFTLWMAAQRAKLPNVGLAKLNFGGKITQKMLDEVEASVKASPATKVAFEKAAGIYAEYNKGLINFAVQTGALSKKIGDALNKDANYVPFYRQSDKGEVLLDIGGAPPIKIGNLADQPYLHELIGGDQPIFDIFTGAMQNTTMLTDMALRNMATKSVANTLGDLGLLKVGANEKGKGIHPGDGPTGVNILRFKSDGEEYWAEVNSEAAGVPSELLVRGMEGVNTSLPQAVKMLNAPARLLRQMVTRNPAYVLRQLIRDPMMATTTAGLDLGAALGAFKQMGKMTFGVDEGESILRRRGTLGGQVLTGTAEDKVGILKSILAGKKGWDYRMAQLDQLAVKADAATRVLMYNNFIKQGLSEMEADLATMEAMNFSKRGISPSLFMLSTMVPFMNAQMQGLSVLYKAFTGKMPFNEKLKVKQKLIQRGLMMMGFTMLYASMMQDDEAYQNANDDEKYGNWFMPNPFGEEHIKVPIPFEIGLLFKAIPEAIVNTAFGDEKARDTVSAIGKMAWNSLPISGPQGVKPALEVAINHSFFTGREIESARLQRFEPGERYTERTSEIAKLVGGALNISPTKIEYLIRGYTGSLPLAVASLANPILRSSDTGEQPDTRGLLSSETPLVGSFFQAKDASGLINKAYKDMEEVNQSKETYKKMMEEGREQEAEAYMDANADMIAMGTMAGKFRKKMGDLTKAERNIRADSTMTGGEKREALDEIKQMKIDLAKTFSSARE